MIHVVQLSTRAKKDLRSVPRYVAIKLLSWVDDVEQNGLEQVKKRPGLHDEPLRGKRQGQRSVRLNRAYRTIYCIRENKIEFVEVMEVNKHAY
ncbi:MAG: type II toxin-antitoxin system mRNA interferase toxin, RelE/StbE family [Deltaproteobacteria bacterium]|nr:type II toxin-antitoxin system mRNA interferase toxin, RelE/StbE family [Deltaproteobacteria bacterium]